MAKKITIKQELQDMLDASMTTEEALNKLNELELPDWDNEPEFMASFVKGMVTEDILTAMTAEGISRSKLAAALGKSRQYISRILNETANFTIDTLAEIACALNRKIEVRMIGKSQHIFVADDYTMNKNKMFSPVRQEFKLYEPSKGLLDSQYMVAEEPAEYEVKKESENEKELTFAA